MVDTLQATLIEQMTDHRETSDVYHGELFRCGRYRVATCRDGLQWLFQRQRFEFAAGGAAWDTLGYCVTRKALIRLHQAYKAPQHENLYGLPKRFKREVVR
jgi:hypothetical protein